MRRIAKVLLTLFIGLVLVFALSRYSQSTLAGHSDCVECHNTANGFTQGYSSSTHHDLYFIEGTYSCVSGTECHPMGGVRPPRTTCVGWRYDATYDYCHTSAVK